MIVKKLFGRNARIVVGGMLCLAGWSSVASPALANQGDDDDFGFRPRRTCEETVEHAFDDAKDALKTLRSRVPPVPMDSAAVFTREEPHVFDRDQDEARVMARMKAVFGDPNYPLWTLYERLDNLSGALIALEKAQSMSLSITEHMQRMGRVLSAQSSAATALAFAAPQAGDDADPAVNPDPVRLLTDNEFTSLAMRLEGVASYIAEYTQCKAILESPKCTPDSHAPRLKNSGT